MKASHCRLGSEEVQLNVRKLSKDRSDQNVEIEDTEEELVNKTTGLFHQMFRTSKPSLLEVLQRE